MTIHRNTFRCLEPMRVRWSEVDLQKIVFNGHYLMYFDTAVAGYWRAMALPYHDTMAALEGDLYVRKATVEYEASAAYDDVLNVGVRTLRIGRTSMTLQCAVFRRDQCLVHGELVYVFADPRTQTSQPVPPALREVLQRFEAGEPMITPTIGDWATTAASVTHLREVLSEHDASLLAQSQCTHDDSACLHVVLHNRMAQPVAVARLAPTGPSDTLQLDAMVVTPVLRHSGLLARLVHAAQSAAMNQGVKALMAEVPQGLAPTLVALGFCPTSPPDDPVVRLIAEGWST